MNNFQGTTCAVIHVIYCNRMFNGNICWWRRA